MSLKLYAIRDRLIGYFMQPFPGPSDHQVKAAVANNVNNTESNHAVTQAPHQFELWRLAGIDEETGKVTGEPEYLCDLSSLVRGDLRRAGDPGTRTVQNPESRSHGTPGTPPGATSADQRAPESPAQAEDRQGASAHPKP